MYSEDLTKVYNALNDVEVKGFKNISVMAGAMSVLRDIIVEMQKEATRVACEPEKE